nr:hypothetical protein [Shewanella algidipiscicola]
MQKHLPLLVIILLFSAAAASLIWINQTQQTSGPETWSAFIYTQGFNSGRYQKQDDFEDYPSCKIFAEQQAQGDVVWECGLRCRFDSSRQGFQCETMRRD